MDNIASYLVHPWLQTLSWVSFEGWESWIPADPVYTNGRGLYTLRILINTSGVIKTKYYYFWWYGKNVHIVDASVPSSFSFSILVRHVKTCIKQGNIILWWFLMFCFPPISDVFLDANNIFVTRVMQRCNKLVLHFSAKIIAFITTPLKCDSLWWKTAYGCSPKQ